MIRCIALAFSLGLALAVNSPAQGDSPRTVKCRLVAFEKLPGSPDELFVQSAVDGEFIENRLSLSIDAPPVDYPVPANRKLVFRAAPDAQSEVVATATLPSKAGQMILLLFPSSAGGKPGYRVIPIVESDENTPKGGAFVCNVSRHKARVALGEFRHELKPGQTASISQPKKRNAHNMAPLLIQMSGKDEWITVKNTPTRFSMRDRYFMFTYIKPGSNRPMVKVYQQVVPIDIPGADDAP